MKKDLVSYKIIEENINFLVVHKEIDIPFHNTEKKQGLLNLLRENENIQNIFAVHRLDTLTSGLLLFAKNRKMANELSNLFRKRKIEKVYLALSNRKAKKNKGFIEGDMQRSRRGMWRLLPNTSQAFLPSKNPKKYWASTSFFSLPVYEKERAGLRLYVLHPKTGRTHQIRVAMKSNASPILGDPLYSQYDLARIEERMYLHAYALRFFWDDQLFLFKQKPTRGKEFLSLAFEKSLQKVETNLF